MSSSGGGRSPEERRAADLAAGARRNAGDPARGTAARPGEDGGEAAAGPLALASALSDKLTEIGRRLDQYSAFGRRSRRVIIALAVSFALDITLTVVLSIVALAAHGTASANAQLVAELHAQQTALHAAQLTSCGNGNVFRDNQDVIWRDFIGLIARPSAGEPAAQAAKTAREAAQFLAYVATVNHPVNCTALYG